MHITRTLAALGLAAAALAIATTSPATADDPTAASVDAAAAAVTTNELDCHEVGIPRAVQFDPLREFVPARYTLARIGTAAARVTITTYTCFDVSVDGQPVVGRDKPTTVTIGSANVTARDGIPLALNEQQYIVWYATNNPVLFAKLQQTGLPIDFLPRGISATVTEDGTTNTAAWDIGGAGLDYTVSASRPAPATDPTTGPVTGISTFWYDGPQGDLKVTYENHFVLPTPSVPTSADFTSNTLLDRIIAQRSNLVVDPANPTARFGYIRGSWSSAVSFVPAP